MKGMPEIVFLDALSLFSLPHRYGNVESQIQLAPMMHIVCLSLIFLFFPRLFAFCPPPRLNPSSLSPSILSSLLQPSGFQVRQRLIGSCCDSQWNELRVDECQPCSRGLRQQQMLQLPAGATEAHEIRLSHLFFSLCFSQLKQVGAKKRFQIVPEFILSVETGTFL